MNNILNNLNNFKGDSILDYWKALKINNKDNFFISDEINWKLSKNDFDKKVFVLAEYFKKFEEKNIWVLLPASSFCVIVIFALILAKKTPIMLNWTLSEKAFDHCVHFSQIQNIITSRNFLEKISINFLENYKNKFLFLEDFRKDISNFMKISWFLRSSFFIIPKIKSEETAVLLFTSGTENLPKAVQLSHKNILENIFWTLKMIEITSQNKFLSFLPPFHSFGFTIWNILPIITWLQTIFVANPNDSYKINSIIKNEKITIIISAPTFLKMILDLEDKNALKSLEIAIIGSEKCSEQIYEKAKKFSNCKIIEWYGITECSPVISVNPRNFQKKWSVWKILENLECKIINQENKKENTFWEIWEIYISGSSVFLGYLDKNIENPFVEIDWKKFYKTWDIWHIDNDWFLFISGRVKRFIKIAWEMISLSMIENILQKEFWEIIVEAKEEWENKKIVIFSKKALDINEVNIFLQKNNIAKIIKIHENIVIDNFPILWIWKYDYKILKNMISFDSINTNNVHEENVENILKAKIRELTENENLQIFYESEFWKDIIIDSIDVWELMIFIRKKYNLTKEIEISKIKTFKDLVDLIK